MKKIISYSWQQMTEDIDSIAKELELKSFLFKNIYGVPRGGIIPAVMLSHRLNIPMIFSKNKISEDTLIVDDISDTGKTLKKISKKAYIVTLWTSPHTKVKPNIYRNILKKEEWVLFPFETIKSSKRDNK